MNAHDVKTVGRATSRIVTKPSGFTRPSVASGIWVNTTTMITAAHALHNMKEVKAEEEPGKEVAHGYYDDIWDSTAGVSSYLMRADKTNVLHDGTYHTDIAILKSVGYFFGFPAGLDLDTRVPIGAKVAVIGYPCQYDHQWIKRQHPTIPDAKLAYDAEAKKLLPLDHLCVTYGDVTSIGSIQHYTLSSAPGMSGGPVVYKGKVVGINRLNNCRTHRDSPRLR